MAERQRHRKVKLEPISLEELAQTPGLTGMLSYLQRPPGEFPAPELTDDSAPAPVRLAAAPDAAQPVASTDAAVSADRIAGAPEVTAPEVSAPEDVTGLKLSGLYSSGAPDPGAPDVNAGAANEGAPGVITGAPAFTAPELAPPQVEPQVAMTGAFTPAVAPPDALLLQRTGAPELDLSLLDAPGYLYVRPIRYTPVRIDTVQDGHTHGEQALYATLWRLARKTETPSVKSITTGERTLAAEVPMSYSSVQDNLRALVTKHSIAIIPRGANRPKTYLVYDYEEVLRRRRAAGLVYAIRRTSSVTLVTSGAVNHGAPEVTAPNSGAPLYTATAPRAGAPGVNPTAPSLSTSGAPNSGAPYIGSQEITSRTTTLAVAAVLREELGVVDSDAAERIVSGCRTYAPDATGEEIAILCRDQARRYRNMRSVDNPVGMLIRQLPKSFQGPAFTEFRLAQHQLHEAERQRKQSERLQWMRILQDPDESDEMKRIAREALGQDLQ